MGGNEKTGRGGQADLLVVTQAESSIFETMYVFHIKDGRLKPIDFSLPKEGEIYKGFSHYNNVKANSDGTFQSDDDNSMEFYWTYYTWKLDETAGMLKLVDGRIVENN